MLSKKVTLDTDGCGEGGEKKMRLKITIGTVPAELMAVAAQVPPADAG